MTGVVAAPPPPAELAPAWSQSLGAGAAGIALLHIEHARSGAGSWAAAHEWVAAAARGPVIAHPNACGLFQGAPAVAFMLHSAGQPAYARALATLDRHIDTMTRHRLTQAHHRIDRGQPPTLREYDLISGLTGIGAYLLHRHGSSELLQDVLAYLIRLTEPLTINGTLLPGWWCAAGPGSQPADRWHGGHANLGMAHGIAGPLALLATAIRRGITVPGHAEAIDRICRWLDQWRCGTGTRTWWPETISLDELQAGAVQRPGPSRPSWCYGTPGLARAQQLAGLALADSLLQARAEQALLDCITDPHQLGQLRDASLCHGWAGVLLCTWRAVADASSNSGLGAQLPRLQAALDEHLDRRGLLEGDGMLEGSAGVHLVQQTITRNEPTATSWDACLLLTG